MMHLHSLKYDTKGFVSFLDLLSIIFQLPFHLRYLEKYWLCIHVYVHTYRHGLMCMSVYVHVREKIGLSTLTCTNYLVSSSNTEIRVFLCFQVPSYPNFFADLIFFHSRPYIIVKKRKPAVTNKHMEELAQGYR